MIKILDCTLRDGGYVNNWEFGKESIDRILYGLISANIDIIELGFLRANKYNENRTVYPDMKHVRCLLKDKSRFCKYALMAEASNQIDVSGLENYSPDDVDYIRVIIWKTKHDNNGKETDALSEGYRYCKELADKGYKLCIQPARTEQYSDDEFVAMLNMYASLSPYAIYVVDSWGTMYTNDIVHYLNLADNYLPGDICLGYHGHNNMMQAFGTAETLTELRLKRDLIIDSSVFGIGRGAGNLNTELIAKYLNHVTLSSYNINELLSIYENSIKQIYKQCQWGYSIPLFVTAQYHANPNYGNYLNDEKKLSIDEIDKIISEMSVMEKKIFHRI